MKVGKLSFYVQTGKVLQRQFDPCMAAFKPPVKSFAYLKLLFFS